MSPEIAPRKRGMLVAAVAAAFALAAVGAGALLANIAERKSEARNPVVRVVELTDDTDDPAIWGKNFPVEYDLYRKTTDMQRTKYGGSEAIPRTATEQDPRTVTSQSKTDADPRLKAMWAGYAFAADFREERGHAYTLDDQKFTQRQVVVKQPGACIQCHASSYVPMKKLGNGDIWKGFEALNHMPYTEAVKHVNHPVACIDCHDSQTMQLRVTRPAFIEGMRAFKKDPATGKQGQLGDLKEGAFFGEMSILTGQPRMASVVALTRCELLELDRPTLDGITKSHPHVWDVLREFAEKRAAQPSR